MLRGLPEAAEHATETIGVADRVGDIWASVNGRINLFTVLAQEGVGTDADDVLAIVDAAASVGAHEEAYRAIVNFVWSADGYLAVGEIEATATAGREGRLPPPPIIAAYLELSIAASLYVPAGRWVDADAILVGIDGPSLSATSNLLWRPTVGSTRSPSRRPGNRRVVADRSYQCCDRERGDATDHSDGERGVCRGCSWPADATSFDAAAEEILAAVGDQWPTVFSVDAVLRDIRGGRRARVARAVDRVRSSAFRRRGVTRADEASRSWLRRD